MGDQGFVYVLTNPSFRDDWVKIGKSSRLPEVRGRELYNTAVPLPYEIYCTLKTEKYSEAERMIHKSIDRLTKLRINPNREFFNIAPEKAFEILSDIKDLLGDEAILEIKGDNTEVLTKSPSGHKTRTGERFDFYKRGLKDGDIIRFVEDEAIVAVVCNARQVIFEGETWYLSPLVRELYTRMNRVSVSGAYQGPLFFAYQGKRLTELETIKS